MSELVAKVAAAQHIGARSRQEDSLVTHVPEAGGPVVAVLSDGMGGHEDGDLASRIIASEMFGEVFVASSRQSAVEHRAPEMFRAALDVTNLRLRQHIDAGRLQRDTGGTLVCLTIFGGRLRWVSVGDSPLYLFREGRLQRLNQVHSLAAQLDLLVSANQLDADEAQNHPDRDCLTSAVMGREIPWIDCPEGGQTLVPGDVVVLASDGLNVLADADIAAILRRGRSKPSHAVADRLLQAVQRKRAPYQDNISIIAIRVEAAAAGAVGFPMRLQNWVSRHLGRSPLAVAGQRTS